MPEMIDYEYRGEVYKIPQDLTLTPMQLMAKRFDEWAATQPAPPPEAVKAAEGWAPVRKLGPVVWVTQEMIDDTPTLDQIMGMARKAQIARYIATQNELRWQDDESYDSPVVERGYN